MNTHDGMSPFYMDNLWFWSCMLAWGYGSNL